VLLFTGFFRFLACREAKLAYRAEVFELQKQIARQQAQFDLLAGQASSLIQGRRARVSAMSTVSVQLISLDEILSSRNLEVFLLSCILKDIFM
jgi:HAUS augmin-like complex subunit 3